MATKNKVKFGLKNVHYALLQEGEEGTITYGTPVPMPGAVSMSLAPQGDTNTFYSTANNGYQGDLEIAVIPDSFRTDVLGETVDTTSKVQIENAGAEAKPFALLYQFEGDQKASLRVLYNCSAARANEDGSTINETKTPSTETISITASPLANGNIKAKTTDETTEEVRNNWFKTVWQPTPVGV